MTADEFRSAALSFLEASEESHMGHPDFRANGKIFATISPDRKRGMVKLTPDQQQGYLDEYPDTFEPASGAWGRQGCTMVVLRSADKAIVEGAIELAWQNAIRNSTAKRSRRAD